MSQQVALLTDSTWSMPPALAEELGVHVLPLHVSAGAVSLADVPENEARIKELLQSGKVTTSQPATAEIRAALQKVVAEGATAVVAIHISGALSGTCDAVRVTGEAFRMETGVPVEVVDTRTVGAAIGFAVIAARKVLEQGGDAAAAATAARAVAESSSLWLTVADLRHLQRGGRLSASHALIGSALGVRPILRVADGKLGLVESQRGEARTRARLVALVIQEARAAIEAGATAIDFAVQHTGDGPADRLAHDLRDAAAGAGIPVGSFLQGKVSAVLAVHAGPGGMAVVVAPAS